MSVAENKTIYTPEDLLAMPSGKGSELVDGELVEKKMGFRSSHIGGRMFRLLDVHCESHGLGWVLPSETGYQCFPDAPNKVRKPDVSFIRADRLLANEIPEGFATIAPDLAVEVVSPNDLFREVALKISEYLSAGVQLGWVIDPTAEQVHVYHQDGRGTILNRDDELSGEDVVEGFRCKVADLFRPPAGVKAASDT